MPGSLPILDVEPSEAELARRLRADPVLDDAAMQDALAEARAIAAVARRNAASYSAEQVMAAYPLQDPEGRRILELAEAVLRIPDIPTRDALIADKLMHGTWQRPRLPFAIRLAGLALTLGAWVLRRRGGAGIVAGLCRLAAVPLRFFVVGAMRILGGQFVCATTIDRALRNARRSGDCMSFDMLGEAARSSQDVARYMAAYRDAIAAVGASGQPAKRTGAQNIHDNHGVSIKLSALSCRFQTRYWDHEGAALCARALELACLAKAHNIPLTIDAEETGRLSPTLAVFAFLLDHPALAGWDGLGIVVQAYARHAGPEIDWLVSRARQTRRKIHLRLVKGAYWDSEIKLAQEKGLTDFPVFTDKTLTDLAYLAHARTLMRHSQWIHPQFASHNATTLAIIARMARQMAPHNIEVPGIEVQRLYGMGAAVHDAMVRRHGVRSRIYAPVGPHEDLLAYLVRRILENGANASFMNQIADRRRPVADIIRNPYQDALALDRLRTGAGLYGAERRNSRGFDNEDPAAIARFLEARTPPGGLAAPVDVAVCFDRADQCDWHRCPAGDRAAVIDRIADLFESEAGHFYHLLATEAGKTMDDAIGELREAVDFCRYYAAGARQLGPHHHPRGVVVAISPWNFPLAIFTGQIVAALAAGNAVIAKPAEQTPDIAGFAIALMHRAGVPVSAVQLVLGRGAIIGAQLVGGGRADMVVFTGSTATAKHIERAIAGSAKPLAPLLAETGGINAMIVDSSALLERVVDDVLTSAFQSAGQRCSALRVLYVQDSVAARLKLMLRAAASDLYMGCPDDPAMDIGPVIDAEAKQHIEDHVAAAAGDGRLIWRGTPVGGESYCAPAIIEISGIDDLADEIFGPVLHVASYAPGNEEQVAQAINRTGYGLTFGMHSRIDNHIKSTSDAVRAGNIYINRNQIGAIVGSQPFGGVGLSGTGPKAGGPLYLQAFCKTADSPGIMRKPVLLPGPDGERNAYQRRPRGRVLVVHPNSEISAQLVQLAVDAGNQITVSAEIPSHLDGYDAVMTDDDAAIDGQALRCLMAASGPGVLPIITGPSPWLFTESHSCRDLTASGGNLDLLSGL